MALGLTAGGCTSVMPYQRGVLADPMMSFDPQEDPTAGLEGKAVVVNNNTHATEYAGGSQGSGGGCPSCK